MRTIVIWDTIGNEPISFIVLEGDYRHLNDVYINSSMDDNKKQKELSALMYDQSSDDWPFRQDTLKEFPAHQDGDVVIVAGFIP